MNPSNVRTKLYFDTSPVKIIYEVYSSTVYSGYISFDILVVYLMSPNIIYFVIFLIDYIVRGAGALG